MSNKESNEYMARLLNKYRVSILDDTNYVSDDEIAEYENVRNSLEREVEDILKN